MHSRLKYVVFFAASAAAPVFCTAGQDALSGTFWPDAVFARGGFSATSPHNDAREFRLGADWFWRLPADTVGDFIVSPGVELSLGYFEANDEGAFIGGVGPALVVGYKGFPVFIEGSVCATYVSRHTFGPLNIGVDFQFTSGLGFVWQVTERFSVAYRFQHMSNASLSENNPGVNLHVFSATIRF